MLDMLYIIMFIFALLLILIIADFEYNGYPYYWGLMLTLLDAILWFILAAGVFEIEQPYTMYNSSSGAIESGIHIVSSKVSPEISYFCLMMAMVMTVYMGYAVLSTFRQLYDDNGRLNNRWRRR